MKARIRRFTRSERVAHWLLAAAFFAMLLSGSQVPPGESPRPRASCPGRSTAPTAPGSRRAGCSSGGRRPPADRFNAGQKMNARLLAFGLLGLYATGLYPRQACT